MQKLSDGPAFDVIFCDVMMPEMSGIEVSQRIVQRYPGQERRVVFMTGGAFAEPAAQFIASTPNPKLKKPITGTSVRALVSTVARRTRGGLAWFVFMVTGLGRAVLAFGGTVRCSA